MSVSRLLARAAPLVLTLSLAAAPGLAGVALAADDEVVVRFGDTLTGISKRHGVPVRTLVDLNGIADPNRIFAGQRLRISGSPPTPTAPASDATQGGAGTHTVGRGDNLWSIARYYGVSLSALVAANGIANASRIHPGMQLVIPGSAPSAPPPAAPAAAPAPAPGVPAWMAALMAQREPIRQLIVEEATAAGVPVSFALAVAWQESGWRQNVVSSAGAVGVMQLMPGTAQWVGQAMLGAPVNIDDARDNVRAGVRLLAHYLDRYAGNRDLVLAAYYQGQTAADRHGVYPVSRSYIASVTALVRLFGG